MDHNEATTVYIGEQVEGRTGHLGEIHQFVVNPSDDRVTGIVVRRGSLMPEDRVIPLADLGTRPGHGLFLDIDEEQFSAYDRFDPERYRQPGADYGGPPGFDHASGENFMLDTATSFGGASGVWAAGPPIGYNGPQSYAPATPELPVIAKGDPVYDCDMNKIGSVYEFEAEPLRGMPTRLIVRKGWLLHKEADVPIEHISDLSDEGVVLSLSKEQTKQMFV